MKDFDEVKKNKKEDGNKIVVSKNIMIFVGISTGLLAVIWVTLAWIYIPNPFVFIMENIPEVIGTLISLALLVFGISLANKGIFNKGGTDYYPTCYGEKKLHVYLKKYDEFNDWETIQFEIRKMFKTRSSDPYDCEYFDCVMQLERRDEVFKKVWNDFNYTNAIEKRNTAQEIYMGKLRRYVYYSVYYHTKEKK